MKRQTRPALLREDLKMPRKDLKISFAVVSLFESNSATIVLEAERGADETTHFDDMPG